jgi:putative ABC transport system permease protein
MTFWSRFRSWLGALMRRSRMESEMDAELRFHIETFAADLMRNGVSRQEALRRAHIEFGGVERTKEECREARAVGLIVGLRGDIRFALRNLRKHALLSATVVITLALGLGVSTVVFTFVDATALRARVDKDPDSFVRVYSTYTTDPVNPGRPGSTTLEDYRAFRDHAQSLRDVVAWRRVTVPLGQNDSSETWVLLVTCDFFRLYPLERPGLGRLLEDDDCAASRPVVVLSETLWRDRFAADPRVIGKIVSFNGQSVTVVGITPSAFAGQIKGAQAWFPYTLQPYLRLGPDFLKATDAPWLTVEGRLSPGFSKASATAELSLLARQQDLLHLLRKSAVTLTNGSMLEEPEIHRTVSSLVALTIGVLAFVVVIVCANVTALLLSRGDARRQEVAIRLALGATKPALVRMLLIETLVLASLAGLACLYFVYRLPGILMHWLVTGPVKWPVYPDWRVFVYLAAITLVAGTLAGFAPAIESLRVNLTDALKGRRSLIGGGGTGFSLRALLIAGQVAASLFLLVGAGLFLRAHHQMSAAGPGYETRQVLIPSLFLRDPHEFTQSWRAFHSMLMQRLQAVPGVQSVAYASEQPSNDEGEPKSESVQLAGQALRPVHLNEVSPEFFATLGIPILGGRGLQETDSACGKTVCRVVVSEEFVKEFRPPGGPLGMTMRTSRGATLEVVGVARDTSSALHGRPDSPLIYEPWAPDAGPYAPILRFSGDAVVVGQAVSAVLRESCPGAYLDVRTIQSEIDANMNGFWHLEVLIAILGGVAVSLAIIGIYGVISFAVSRRTQEIGVRVALGARHSDIYGAVIKSSVRPIIAGMIVGESLALTGAWILSRVLQRNPFMPLRSNDPVAFAAVPILVAAVALAACYIPARRAMRVDPIVVLRYE